MIQSNRKWFMSFHDEKQLLRVFAFAFYLEISFSTFSPSNLHCIEFGLTIKEGPFRTSIVGDRMEIVGELDHLRL